MQMNIELEGYKNLILVTLCFLIVLLGLMVNKLIFEYQNSFIVEDTIFLAQDYHQLNTSLVDIELTLLKKSKKSNNISNDHLVLKIDTLLNKVLEIKENQSPEVLGYNKEIQILMKPIDQFVNEKILVVDKKNEISINDIKYLRNMVTKVRSKISNVAFQVYRLAVVQSQEHRVNFSRQLIWTSSSSFFLLVMLVGLLYLLDRIRKSAIRRTYELTASSKQLALTVAGSMDAIIIADGFSKIIEYNTYAQGVFGWSREEIIGRTMEELFFPKGLRDAYKNAADQSLEQKNATEIEGVRVELTALRKNGEEFPTELNMTYVERKNDAIYMAYIRDISDQKLAEKKLIEARDRAERTDKAKSQFLAIMSHEMRTPLAGIVGVMDLLKTTKLTKKQKHYVQIATSSSEILLEHINEALDITRIEDGALRLSTQEFNLVDLVRSLIDVLKPLANEKGLKLELQIDGNINTNFIGDKHRIRQVLTNLVGNSIKFTETGSIKLLINCSQGSGCFNFKFNIIDTGVGIALENHEKIFDEFVSISFGDARQMRGDGLGLSISRKIARKMGGDIFVESDIYKGANFILSIPLIPAAKTDVVKANISSTPEEVSKSLNVLVVEDSVTNMGVLCDMLEGMGHTVSRASNGLESLDQAKNQIFDIIFMDINMPKLGGIEAVEKIRSDGGLNSKTYIVGLTAHSSDEFGVDAEQAGMNCYYTKPIRLDALRGILSDHISASSFESNGDLSPVLKELFETIGIEKALGFVWIFFEELEVFIKQCNQGIFEKDNKALAEAAHKLQGASAMLGQELLEELFSQLEIDAHNNAINDLTFRIQALKSIANQSKESLRNMYP